MDNATQYAAWNDQQLIAAINAGDALAFEVLYYRHCDWVVNLAFHFTREQNLALDVMQETFVYFFKKFPGFKATAQVRTFLYPCVRDKALAASRKASRCQSNEAGLAELESVISTHIATQPTEDFDHLLAGLSRDHREVVRLRFVDELTLGEIAQAIGIPVGTVKSRLHHALHSLRRKRANSAPVNSLAASCL